MGEDWISSAELAELISHHSPVSAEGIDQRLSLAIRSGMLAVNTSLVSYAHKAIPPIPGSPIVHGSKYERIGAAAPGCLDPKLLSEADDVSVSLGSDMMVVSGRLDPFGLTKSDMRIDAFGLTFPAGAALGLFGIADRVLSPSAGEPAATPSAKLDLEAGQRTETVVQAERAPSQPRRRSITKEQRALSKFFKVMEADANGLASKPQAIIYAEYLRWHRTSYQISSQKPLQFTAFKKWEARWRKGEHW